MGLKRALLEAALAATAVTATIFTSFQPVSGWSDVVIGLFKAIPLSLCCVVSFYYNDLYDLRIVPTFRDFASRLLQAVGVALMLLAAFYIFLPGAMRLSYKALALCLLSILIVLVPIRAVSYRLLRRDSFGERVLILGRGPMAAKILHEIEVRPYLGCEVVGAADDSNSPATAAASAYPLLGPLEHLARIVEETYPDRIILALSEWPARPPVRQLLDAQMNGIIIEDGVDAFERITGKIAIESMTPINLIISKDSRKSRLDDAINRVTSLAVAAIGIVVTSPVFCLVALALKIESPESPLFFVQDRVGRRGRRFRLVKFRTMRVVTTDIASEWVTDNSDRITSVGRVLRRYRLDELPQLWNVMLGDMNLRDINIKIFPPNLGTAREADLGVLSFFDRDPRMRVIRPIVEAVAASDDPVLIHGERAVDRDLVARAVHAKSARRDGPFVKVNCAAMVPELLESELFGSETGVFTGRHQRTPGQFENANKGTLFLDEIVDLSLALQAKLLHMLQERRRTRALTFWAPGARGIINVDTRVIAATNRDLVEAVRRGEFREELYYRLNGAEIRVPPSPPKEDGGDNDPGPDQPTVPRHPVPVEAGGRLGRLKPRGHYA